MFKKKSGQRGFTLIELLVVIAIIGILSSVVLVSLNSARAKARDAKRVSDIAGIQTAMALYYDTNSAYPAGVDNAALQLLVDGGFLSALPAAPAINGTDIYNYVAGDSNQKYHLSAQLEGALPSSDRNCDSTVSGGATGCFATGVAALSGGFDGAAATVYDVTP